MTRKKNSRVPGSSSKPVPTLTLSKRTGTVQTAKVFEIPFEVFSEIFSYLPTFPKCFTSTSYHREDSAAGAPESYLCQTDVIRTLSQTCQQWRNAFLPVVWSRLDMSATHSKAPAWYKTFGEIVIARSRFVIANPELAQYIRILSVTITRYSPNHVLTALVNLMKHLPHMDTVLIYRVHSQQTTLLKTYFEGNSFPQVTTVNLPTEAHNILRCFPNATKVVFTLPSDGSQLVSAMATMCRKVKEVDGLNGALNVMKRIPKSIPNLCTIKFRSIIPAECLQPLLKMKTIICIAFYSEFPDEQQFMSNKEAQLTLKLAKEIVRQSELAAADQRKTVVVKYPPPWKKASPEAWCKTFDLT